MVIPACVLPNAPSHCTSRTSSGVCPFSGIPNAVAMAKPVQITHTRKNGCCCFIVVILIVQLVRAQELGPSALHYWPLYGRLVGNGESAGINRHVVGEAE